MMWYFDYFRSPDIWSSNSPIEAYAVIVIFFSLFFTFFILDFRQSLFFHTIHIVAFRDISIYTSNCFKYMMCFLHSWNEHLLDILEILLSTCYVSRSFYSLEKYCLNFAYAKYQPMAFFSFCHPNISHAVRGLPH